MYVPSMYTLAPVGVELISREPLEVPPLGEVGGVVGRGVGGKRVIEIVSVLPAVMKAVSVWSL